MSNNNYVEMWTPEIGYETIIGDYKYTVIENDDELHIYYLQVETVNKTKSAYSSIQESLFFNGQEFTVVSLENCFKDCISLTTAPSIPAAILNLDNCFNNCPNLEGNIIIFAWSNDITHNNTFDGTQKNIYIVRNSSDISDASAALANGYNNVHFEANDNPVPNVFFTYERGSYSESDPVWTVDDTGDDVHLQGQVILSTDKLPIGWNNGLKPQSLDPLKVSGIEVFWNNSKITTEPSDKTHITINSNNTFEIFIESQETAGTVKVQATDVHNHNSLYSDYVTQAFILLDFMPGGQGMAVGKAGYRNGLDISIPTAIGEGLELPQKQVYKKTTDSTINSTKTYYIWDEVSEQYVEVAEPNVEQIDSYYEYVWTVDLNNYQLVVGKYNKLNEDAVFIVGNGNIDEFGNITQSNLMEVGTDLITIGNKDKIYTELDENGQRFYQNNRIIANIGYGSGASESGTAVAPYYTLGIRLNSSTVGNYSVAEGYSTRASGTYAHAEGESTTASGVACHAEGNDTAASGKFSHAEGLYTTAQGQASHAEGRETMATGVRSHAEGYDTTASGQDAHAEGYNTTASGGQSHAEGYNTTASGLTSHAQNYSTIAASRSQTALGRYNVEDNTNTYAVIVGNGDSDNARSNALTVDWQGNVMAQSMAGQIIMYAGVAINSTDVDEHVTSTAPSGWLVCDGTPVLIDDYPELAAVLLLDSTTTPPTYLYGGDSTHFNLPDFRGRVGVGVGQGTATGATNHTLGQKNGAENAIVPYHTHAHALTWSQSGTNKTLTGSHLLRKAGTSTEIISNASGITSTYDSTAGAVKNLPAVTDTTSVRSVVHIDATHTHTGTIGGSITAKGTNADGTNASSTNTDGANMQPYIGINYIIATGKTN